MTLVTEESSGGASRHLGQDVLCDGGEQKSQHLLVYGDPVAVEGVGDVDFLLPLLLLCCCRWGLGRAGEVVLKASPSHYSKNLRLP